MDYIEDLGGVDFLSSSHSRLDVLLVLEEVGVLCSLGEDEVDFLKG